MGVSSFFKFLTVLIFTFSFSTQALPPLSPYEVNSQQFSQIQEKIARSGDLTPIPELKSAVRDLEQKLNSPEVIEAAKSNSTLEQFRQMALTSLFHVDIEFRIEIQNDAYPIPFEKPFPFRPTLEALSDGIKFFEVLEKTHPTLAHLKPQISKGQLTWFSLVHGNKTNESSLNLFPTKTQIKTRIFPEKEILADPVRKYAEFSRRIREKGENSPFPEFQPAIRKLEQDLQGGRTLEVSAKNPALEYLRQKSLQRLKEIKLETPDMTPTDKPFSESYPYRPTLHAIVDSLKFFDLLERSQYEEHPDSQVVEESWVDKTQAKKKIEPLYHFDRYKYHWFGLISNPEAVIFPTIEGLSFKDLIRLRSVPLGFIGVETVTHRVDRHYQTPLDFWYHDVNHVRRMVGYTLGRAKSAGAKTPEEKLQVFEEMDHLVIEMLKLIEIPQKPTKPKTGFTNQIDEKRWERDSAQWESEASKKKMIRVLLFEILHESALPASATSIVEDILRKPNTPQPFEYQSFSPDPIGNIEDKRTDNGNLVSGAKKMRALKGDNPTYIHYINDRALGLLANLTNKLRHGFYDSVYELKNYVVPLEYRTPDHVAEAAETLLKTLRVEPPSREELVNWASSEKGSPEKFAKYKGVDSCAATLQQLKR